MIYMKRSFIFESIIESSGFSNMLYRKSKIKNKNIVYDKAILIVYLK